MKTKFLAGALLAFSVALGASAQTSFYPVTPCRVADTRNANGPALAAATSRDFAIAGACGIPAGATAYSLNVTVVPTAGALRFLTIWPAGQPQPAVSTLNDAGGAIVANAAIVAAGAGGAVSVYATDATQVVIDVNGYFAPAQAAGLVIGTGASGALQFDPGSGTVDIITAIMPTKPRANSWTGANDFAFFQLDATPAAPPCAAAADVGRVWLDSTDANNSAVRYCLVVAGKIEWVTR